MLLNEEFMTGLEPEVGAMVSVIFKFLNGASILNRVVYLCYYLKINEINFNIVIKKR